MFADRGAPDDNDVGRAVVALAELLQRCTSVEAAPAALALAIAWQHASLAQAVSPQPVELPALEDLAGPGELISRTAAMAATWNHLHDHIPALHRLVDGLPVWDEVTAVAASDLVKEFIGRTAQGRRLWLDPAGWLLDNLSHRRRLGSPVRLCFYTPPPSEPDAPGRPYPRSGDSIIDEFCGTGYMLASTAAWLRGHGWDPHTCRFFGMDDDDDRLAIASINLIGAGAGPLVWLRRGDPYLCKFVDADGADVDHDVFVTDPATPSLWREREIDAFVLANARPRAVVADAAQRVAAWRGNPPSKPPAGRRRPVA